MVLLLLRPPLVSLTVVPILLELSEEDKKLSPNLLSNRISDGASEEDSQLLSVVSTSVLTEWLNKPLTKVPFKTSSLGTSPNRPSTGYVQKSRNLGYPHMLKSVVPEKSW